MNLKIGILEVHHKCACSLQKERLFTMLEGLSLSFLPALSLNPSLSLSVSSFSRDWFLPIPTKQCTTDSQAVGLWEIFILIDPGGWWVCYERCSSNSLGPTNISKYQSATGGLRTDTGICLWMPRRLNRQENIRPLSGVTSETWRMYVS